MEHEHAINVLEDYVDQIAVRKINNKTELERLASYGAWADRDIVKRLHADNQKIDEQLRSIEITITMLSKL